jgi:hypothetical protein
MVDHLLRLRSTIDQVAEQDDPRRRSAACRIVALDRIEQVRQQIEPAVHVADRIEPLARRHMRAVGRGRLAASTAAAEQILQPPCDHDAYRLAKQITRMSIPADRHRARLRSSEHWQAGIGNQPCRLFTARLSPYSGATERNGRILEGAIVRQFYRLCLGGPQRAPE